MISSRPQIAIVASEPLTPALPTAPRIASTTVGGSLIVPSAMTSGGSDAVPRATRRQVPPDSRNWTTFTALEPMSRPNTSGVFRKRAIINAFPLAGYVV